MATQVSKWSITLKNNSMIANNLCCAEQIPVTLEHKQSKSDLNCAGLRTQSALTSDGFPAYNTQPLLRNGHIQTIWGVYFKKSPVIPTYQEAFQLKDGDQTRLSYCDAKSENWVIILHGLTGCSDANYILGIQKALFEDGFSSVTVNCRGAGGHPNKHARSFHAGHTKDFFEVLNFLRNKPKIKSISALGYSLGGNILLKAMGEEPNLGLASAIAVSPPFDLVACANYVDRGFNRIYRNYLLNRLKNRFLHKRDFLLAQTLEELDGSTKTQHASKAMLDVGCIKSIRSFWSYDNFVVAPIEGFRNVHHYYHNASSKFYLKSIKVPTLIISAKDDPIVPGDSIPTKADISASTQLEAYQHGGHQGFLQIKNNKVEYWLEKRIPHFFKQQVES